MVVREREGEGERGREREGERERGGRERVKPHHNRLVHLGNLQEQASLFFCEVILEDIPKPHNHPVIVMVTTIVTGMFPREQRGTMIHHMHVPL